MNSVLKWTGIATALALVAAVPARATISGFVDTGLTSGTINDPATNGWSIVISGCTATGTLCANDTLTTSVAGSQLSLVFTGTNGPSNNSFLYNSGTGQVDLSLSLVVIAPTGQTIYSATDAFSSSSTTTAPNGAITATETFTGPSEPGLTSTLSPSATLASTAFAPITKSVSDFLDVGAGFGGSKVTTIPSLTLTFNAPEPISSSLLIVGIAGLGFVRRKLSRAK